MRFSDLFTAFGAQWPTEEINVSWPPSGGGASVAGLIAQIDDAVRVHRPSVDVGSGGTLTVSGELRLASAPARTELVSKFFPSFRFVFAGDMDWRSDFRVSVARDGTYSLQIDTLPLEILLPSDFLGAHPTRARPEGDTDIELADFAGYSIIKRDFAFVIEPGNILRLEPHFPISIGAARLMGIPVKSVHELSFIASPSRAGALFDWIVRPLDGGDFPPEEGGALGFGGIEIDWDAEDGALSGLRENLRFAESAEFVLEDLILPALPFPPIPRHGTIGVRRSIDPTESLFEQLSFANAPINIPFGDTVSLFFNQLYFKTPDAGQDLIRGLSLEGGLALDFAGGGDRLPDESGDDPDAPAPPDEGDPAEGRWEFEIGLIDGDLLRTSMGWPLPAPGELSIPFLTLDLWAIAIEIQRFRVGVSLSELQAASPDYAKAFQALTTVLIREKTDEEEEEDGEASVEVETEDGKPFELAIVDAGWDRGTFTGDFLTPKDLSLGLGPFSLEFREMGLVAEHGATYFSISGGIRQSTDPFEGKVWFTRLRGPIAGNPDAPSFKLDGFGAELAIKDTVEIGVHGLFRNEVLPDGTRVKEHGLGGKIVIYAGDNKWGLSVDVFWGDRIPPEDPPASYLLFQVVLFGAIPLGPMELQQIEALYANNLVPDLGSEGDEPPEAGELRYYSWLKNARPTALAANRGLSQWRPENDALAFGLGMGVGFPGAGDNCKLVAFGLGFDSEEAAGLVIVVEFFLMEAEDPLALGIFEYDFRRDAFVLQIIIDLELSELIQNFPEELKIKLGGTIVFGNRPGIVAFGRIDKQDTWLGAMIEIDLGDIFELKITAAFCFEWVDDVHTSVGFTFSLRLLGDLGIVRLEGWAAILALLRWMSSGTSDFVARLSFEAGFALELFRFLRIGLSVSLLAEWLAHTPNYFVFRAVFRIETPWFLPDVSFSAEVVSGTLDPAARGVISSPLLDASGAAGPTLAKVAVRRLDGLEGSAAPTLFALDTLPSAATDWRGEAAPLPLHGQVSIRFSPMVADALGIGDIDPDLGVQETGEDEVKLSARYRLVGLTMRRRPVAGGDWEEVENLSSPGGARNYRWGWDLDTRTGGRTAPKTLVLNGKTPFSVSYLNPVADAEILSEAPDYPCCVVRPADTARFDFCNQPFGAVPAGGTRPLRWQLRARIAPMRVQCGPHTVTPVAGSAGSCDRQGVLPASREPSLILTSEEDLSRAEVSWRSAAGAPRVLTILRDAEGEEVERREHRPAGLAQIAFAPAQAFRALEVHVVEQLDDQGERYDSSALAIDYVNCVTLADAQREAGDQARCARLADEGPRSAVAFLPRHEYEITLTTELAVRHTETDWELRNVRESVRFQTAGPPGLNATDAPGQELTPFVEPPMAGGRGVLYREESVHLVLSDQLQVFGPGAPDARDFRLPVTMSVATVFDSNAEKTAGKSAFEGEDWLDARRGADPLRIAMPLKDPVPALTRDPLALRLKRLNDASTGRCPPDDVWNEMRPRLGVAPFDARGRPLWQPMTRYRASMRPEASPLVRRMSFAPEDLAAFADRRGEWEVSDGMMRARASASARFGDADWDHFTLDTVADLGAGGVFAVAVLVAAENEGGGLKFELTRRSDGTGVLLAVSMDAGAVFDAVDVPEMRDSTGMEVSCFADLIRCRAAGQTLEIARGARGGGVCEISGRNVDIRSLNVRGLEMTGFDFETSRYRSFAEHIGSAEGAGQIDLGSGSEGLGDLLARMDGDITAAMDPAASDDQRERVFNAAASALAVPLREAPERLHVDAARSRSSAFFLLESPEPIDFTSETQITLRRLVTVRRPPLFDFRDLIVPRRPGLGGLPAWRFGQLPGAGFPSGAQPGRFTPQPGMQRAGGAYGQAARGAFKRAKKRILLPNRGRLKTRAMPLHRLSAMPGMARGLRKPIRGDAPAGRRGAIAAAALSARQRAAILRSPLRPGLLERLFGPGGRSRREWREVGVRILQNGPRTKALLLPLDAQVPAGQWQIDFSLQRRWFETSDPLGPENAYLAGATLDFEVE